MPHPYFEQNKQNLLNFPWKIEIKNIFTDEFVGSISCLVNKQTYSVSILYYGIEEHMRFLL